jgi:hypothetical protein
MIQKLFIYVGLALFLLASPAVAPQSAGVVSVAWAKEIFSTFTVFE